MFLEGRSAKLTQWQTDHGNRHGPGWPQSGRFRAARISDTPPPLRESEQPGAPDFGCHRL